MGKNKIEDVYDEMLSKPKSIKELEKPKDIEGIQEPFTRVNFFISKEQKRKLEEYTQKISPAHIRISQSELIRYLIENMNLEEIRKNYFKLKE